MLIPALGIGIAALIGKIFRLFHQLTKFDLSP